MTYEKLGLQDGTVLTAEHLNHIEEGIEKASNGGGVTDYNDLENRPCYIEYKDDTTSLIGFYMSSGDTFYMEEAGCFISTATFNQNEYIIEKEPYIIKYNDVTYENCYATNIDGVMHLGNMGLQGGEDTGEPFVVMFPTPTQAEELGMSGATSIIITSDGATELKMGIMRKQIKKIEKLDARCLPDRNTPIVFEIIPNEEGTDYTIHCNLTIYDIVYKLNVDPTIPIIVLLIGSTLYATSVTIDESNFQAYFIDIHNTHPYAHMYKLTTTGSRYLWTMVSSIS